MKIIVRLEEKGAFDTLKPEEDFRIDEKHKTTQCDVCCGTALTVFIRHNDMKESEEAI